MSIFGKIGKALDDVASQVIDEVSVRTAFQSGKEGQPRPLSHSLPHVNIRVMRAWEDGRAEYLARLSGNLPRE